MMFFLTPDHAALARLSQSLGRHFLPYRMLRNSRDDRADRQSIIILGHPVLFRPDLVVRGFGLLSTTGSGSVVYSHHGEQNQ